MRHALITGGAGFIGSHLVDALLGEQPAWRVTVLDNFDPFYPPAVKRQNLAAATANPNFRLLELDLRDETALASQFPADVDVIIHLAARAGVRPSIREPRACLDINVQGTSNLLEEARKQGIKQFIFASSSSVYGNHPDVPWEEKAGPLMPISPYAAAKLACEHLGAVYSHLYGIRFLALRFFTVYGPRQRPDLAIHKFAKALAVKKEITVFGDGSTQRDYTYVNDTISGVRAAIDYKQSDFEIINLGNHTPIALNTLLATMEDVFGASFQCKPMPEQPGDVRNTYANVSKAAALLGYAPATPLRDGLTAFKAWCEAQPGWPNH